MVPIICTNFDFDSFFFVGDLLIIDITSSSTNKMKNNMQTRNLEINNYGMHATKGLEFNFSIDLTQKN